MSEISSIVHIEATVGVEHHCTHADTHPDAPTFSSWRLVGDGDRAYLIGTPEDMEALAERILAAVATFRSSGELVLDPSLPADEYHRRYVARFGAPA